MKQLARAVMSRIGRSSSKYLAVFALSVQNALAYFYDALVQTAFTAAIIFVFVHLWRTTYSLTGRGSIAGFTLAQIIWYLVLTESIFMGRVRYVRRMDEEVRSGHIAYSLNKPYNYLLFQYATFLGESLVKVAASFMVGGAVAFAAVGGIRVPLASVIPVALAVLLGLTLDFAMCASIGLLAFWVEDTAPFGVIHGCLTLLLGGTVLPLELFPEGVRRVARALPMNQVAYAPSRLFASFDPSSAVRILLQQLAWVAALGILLSVVFELGRRRLDVNGG